jgi:hypothetical protein
MHNDKRQRIIDAGGGVGTVADFLGLSIEEEKFVDTKIRLQQILKQLQMSHPNISIDSDIETIDSLIFNIYKYPLTINDLAYMLLK